MANNFYSIDTWIGAVKQNNSVTDDLLVTDTINSFEISFGVIYDLVVPKEVRNNIAADMNPSIAALFSTIQPFADYEWLHSLNRDTSTWKLRANPNRHNILELGANAYDLLIPVIEQNPLQTPGNHVNILNTPKLYYGYIVERHLTMLGGNTVKVDYRIHHTPHKINYNGGIVPESVAWTHLGSNGVKGTTLVPTSVDRTFTAVDPSSDPENPVTEEITETQYGSVTIPFSDQYIIISKNYSSRANFIAEQQRCLGKVAEEEWYYNQSAGRAMMCIQFSGYEVAPDRYLANIVLQLKPEGWTHDPILVFNINGRNSPELEPLDDYEGDQQKQYFDAEDPSWQKVGVKRFDPFERQTFAPLFSAVWEGLPYQMGNKPLGLGNTVPPEE